MCGNILGISMLIPVRYAACGGKRKKAKAQ